MSLGDAHVCDIVRTHLQQAGVLFEEVPVQNGTRFAARSAVHKAGINVFNSGKMHVDGAECELKAWLNGLKESIETHGGVPGILLPPEVEKFPQTLQSRVPACDGVVLWLYQESLKCYKSGNIAAAAFMLGAASEKAINQLIEAYGASLASDENKAKFAQRINSRMVSVRYDEFKRSFKSAKPQPTDTGVAYELETMLDGAFNYYRVTRNQVGHPQVIPDHDPGVVLASIGQFITYAERIYSLIGFFEQNKLTV